MKKSKTSPSPEEGSVTAPVVLQSGNLKFTPAAPPANGPTTNPAQPPTSPASDPDQSNVQQHFSPFSRSRSSTLPVQTDQSLQSHPQTFSINNRTSVSARKSRQLPQFNILVLGARSTGKTRFIDTLVGTLVPSMPNAVDRSQFKRINATSSLVSTSYNVANLAGERTMLNLVDSAGLDICSGDDFRVDLQMNEILRFIEDKFEESLQVERQVHRNPSRLGESHVHVSVYFIDPSTITHRKASSTSPTFRESSENEQEMEHMSSIDLRQLKRLSRRSNILPVISRSDELTETRLAQLKAVVQRDLKKHGISLGAFDAKDDDGNDSETSSNNEADESESNEHTEGDQASEQSTVKEGEGQTSVAAKRLTRRKSHLVSNSRRRRSSMMNYLRDQLVSMKNLIPLSVFAAEFVPTQGLEGADFDRLNHSYPFSLLPSKQNSRSGAGQEQLASNAESDSGNPINPSIYVRKFKWATVDVLNPNHCEFVIARAILLGSHFSKLKESTRIEKYENYRTEKLLSRRITVNPGPKGLEEQRKIALEVEKIEIPHIQTPRSIFGSQMDPRASNGFVLPPISLGTPEKQKTKLTQPTQDNHVLLDMPTQSSSTDSARKHKSYSTHSFISSRIMKRPSQPAPQPPIQHFHSNEAPGSQQALSNSTGTHMSSNTYPRSPSSHSSYAHDSINRPMVF